MIYFNRTDKTLIIPEGFGGNDGGVDCSEAISIAYSSGHTEGYSEGFADGTTNGEELQKAKLSSVTIQNNGTYTSEDGWSSVTVNTQYGSMLYAIGTVTASAPVILTMSDLNNNYPLGAGVNAAGDAFLSSSTLQWTVLGDLARNGTELPAGEYGIKVILAAGNQWISNCGGDGLWGAFPVDNAGCIKRTFTVGGLSGVLYGLKFE